MSYEKVSWSLGEQFNFEKMRQMVENDEVIHNILLKSMLGTIAADTYFDEDTATITAAPSAWVDIIVLNNVYLYPSRWIKVSATCHGVGADDRGTYIPFRVLMDGNEVLYMRTTDASLNSVQKYCSVSGARIMQSQPGLHTFKLQIGNDYASASNDTYISPLGAKKPTILSIDDMGGNNV